MVEILLLCFLQVSAGRINSAYVYQTKLLNVIYDHAWSSFPGQSTKWCVFQDLIIQFNIRPQEHGGLCFLEI